MTNMSYCRFQNTRRDFAECVDVVQQMTDGSDDEGALSEEELTAAKSLARLAVELLETLTNYAGVDMDDELHDIRVCLSGALTGINSDQAERHEG